jgi:hypothetical protein
MVKKRGVVDGIGGIWSGMVVCQGHLVLEKLVVISKEKRRPL